MQTYFDLFNMTFLIFSVLTIAAFAGLFSERSGIINIAIEGQMVIGALTFALLGSLLPPNLLSVFLAVFCAGLAAMLFSIFHGVTCIKLKGNHLISGVALNLLAAGFAPFVVIVASSGVGDIISKLPSLDFYHQGFFSMFHGYLIVALTLALLSWIFFKKTNLGLRFIAAGENPSALDAAGISVAKYRWIAILISGFLAGIAGAFFLKIVSNYFRGSVQGFGFLALAVLIFGKWRVIPILGAAALFSLFTASAHYNLEILRFVPREFQKLLPFIISLLALVIFSKNPNVPKAAGKSYEKGER